MTPFVRSLPNTRQMLEKAELEVKRLKTVTTALAILLVCSIVFGAVQYARLMLLQQDILEGNQTTCDDDYVAKIVDGSKVTCVMQRLGPAMVTHKVEVRRGREANYQRVLLTKEEMKNENWDENQSYPNIFDNWKLDGRMRNISVPASQPRSTQ